MFVINDSTGNDHLFHFKVDGELKSRGHDPEQVVRGMFAPPSAIQLIPESEWIPRIRDRKKYKTGLRDIRDRSGPSGGPMPSKDQNGQGFCWAYSTTRSCELVRALMGQPYVPLSAHSVACKVKNFRDEGGWCGLSAQFIRENGVIPESLWPAKSMSRSYDTAANWAEAKKYRIVEDFVDLSSPVYDQNLTFAQVISCLLQNIPTVLDFNWWGHSVCGIDVDEVDGEVCPLINNSWTDSWGDNGVGAIQGNRKYPDGSVATRVLHPA